MKDEYSLNGKLKANRIAKQQRKALRKLENGPHIEGFLSQADSQSSIINALTSTGGGGRKEEEAPMTDS